MFSTLSITGIGGVILEFSFGFLISIAIAVYLAVDAPKHNRNPWIWSILGLFFGPIVLGIYLIMTGRKVAGWIIVIFFILLTLLIILLVVAGFFFVFSGM
jgi:hypothetical protein